MLRWGASLTLARIGDASPVGALTQELEKNYPSNTLLKLYWLPTINAAIHLRTGNSSQALVNLEAAVPRELGQAGMFTGPLYPAYIRVQAELRARNGTAAAAEFQTLLNPRGIVGSFVAGALSHLQMPCFCDGRRHGTKRRVHTKTSLPSRKTPTLTFPS